MKKSIKRTVIRVGFLLLILLGIQLAIGSGVDGQGWNWKLGDFVFAGVVFFCFGLAYEFLASRTENKKHRIVIGIVVLLGLMFLWANAVNDFDLLESLVLSLIN
jgi:hypothetical protein